MDITGEQIENYIVNDLGFKPRHNVDGVSRSY